MTGKLRAPACRGARVQRLRSKILLSLCVHEAAAGVNVLGVLLAPPRMRSNRGVPGGTTWSAPAPTASATSVWGLWRRAQDARSAAIQARMRGSRAPRLQRASQSHMLHEPAWDRLPHRNINSSPQVRAKHAVACSRCVLPMQQRPVLRATTHAPDGFDRSRALDRRACGCEAGRAPVGERGEVVPEQLWSTVLGSGACCPS